MKLTFEWDERKSRHNRQAHRVAFDEAKTVFNDPFLITFPDELHSADEERLISLGTSISDRVVLVVHTENYEAPGVVVVRIISARKATALERKVYEKNQR